MKEVSEHLKQDTTHSGIRGVNTMKISGLFKQMYMFNAIFSEGPTKLVVGLTKLIVELPHASPTYSGSSLQRQGSNSSGVGASAVE